MQSKILLKRFLFLLSVTGIAFSSVAVFFLTFYLPGRVYSYYYATKSSYVVGIPVRLNISIIKVNAAIIPVGVNKDGSMEAPSGPKNVGWFKFGPRPGEKGSAVLDGHYGYWKSGEGSVFDDLNKLKKGDEIYVQDEKGMTITFVVKKILTYDPNDETFGVFNSGDGKAHLNIITCEGIWDNIKKTYSNRLVIFSDKQ